jgi:hypothetical protein
MVRKINKYGKDLYYVVNKDDCWLPVIYGQQALTKHNIDYLKMTNRFSFEVEREIL